MNDQPLDVEPLHGEEGALAGTSRRDVLKKGAIVGGLVWATPAITTLSRASAGSHPPCEVTGRGTALQSSGVVVIIPQGDSTGAEVCEASVPPNALQVTGTALCGSFGTGTAASRVAQASLKPAGNDVLTFGAVSSSATQSSDCQGAATVNIASISVNGSPVPFPPEPGCNTVLPPSSLGPLANVVQVILNEQTCAGDGTFTVNAVHVIVFGAGSPFARTDLYLARSQVRNSCCAGSCKTECDPQP